jgi:methylmalonyl-CoA mutase
MMTQIACWAKRSAPQLQTIQIQGHVYHDGGGSSVEELAFTLATGVEYLVELKERGLSIEDIAPRMRFSLSVGSDFFMGIAKFRAARLLWAIIIQAFGCSVESQKMSIHARTSARTKIVYDPYVTILRSTTEASSEMAIARELTQILA